MAGVLLASIPVAIAYNIFLDCFISGITGGAVRQASICIYYALPYRRPLASTIV